MLDLTNRTALITGAARGIGRGLAEALLAAGCNTVLADLGVPGDDWNYALSGSDELQETATALANAYPERQVNAVAVDVTAAASCADAVARTLELQGRIDILCNNAGVVQSGTIESVSEADWDRVFAVNTKGLYLMTQAALPALKAAAPACIINTASIAGKQGYPNMAAYCGSKFAAIGITQSLALELASAEIRVNAICPGMVGTAMWLNHLLPGHSGSNDTAADFEAAMRETIPLGRPQTVADMGDAAVYLAASPNVTGVALTVAGGFEML